MSTPSVASIREVERDRSTLASPAWDRDFAAIAAVIGERSRVAMLLALAGGVALPARDLARAAGVRPSTATAHLGKLAEDGLRPTAQSGRFASRLPANGSVLLARATIISPARSAPISSRPSCGGGYCGGSTCRTGRFGR